MSYHFNLDSGIKVFRLCSLVQLTLGSNAQLNRKREKHKIPTYLSFSVFSLWPSWERQHLRGGKWQLINFDDNLKNVIRFVKVDHIYQGTNPVTISVLKVPFCLDTLAAFGTSASTTKQRMIVSLFKNQNLAQALMQAYFQTHYFKQKQRCLKKFTDPLTAIQTSFFVRLHLCELLPSLSL